LRNIVKPVKKLSFTKKLIQSITILLDQLYKFVVGGVQQRSILSPILFLLHVNNLANISKHCSLLFAEETNAGFIMTKGYYNVCNRHFRTGTNENEHLV